MVLWFLVDQTLLCSTQLCPHPDDKLSASPERQVQKALSLTLRKEGKREGPAKDSFNFYAVDVCIL